MGKFLGFIALVAIIVISALAIDSLNGGQIGLWLSENIHAPETKARF